MKHHGRILPDFIVIGAMKCGTTTLYRQLASHPQIGMSRDKETDFFVAEKNYAMGLDWYADQFSGARRFHGEASPNYTKAPDFPDVPSRIHAHLPEVKLIYVVRDPVQRAEAQFRHSWIMGAVAGSPEDLYGTHEYRHIMDVSRYARQIEAYLEVFPREALLVLDFDEMIARPQAVFDRVTDHIGAARHEIDQGAAYNDSREVSRVPAPLLRLGQTHFGRSTTKLLGRSGRDLVRRILARGPERRPEPFSTMLEARMRNELMEDAAVFRRMTGMAFPSWSV